MNETSERRRSRKLRIVGGFVLALGLCGAGLLYSARTPAPTSTDPSLVGFDDAGNRQMGVLYGKMGLVIDQLIHDMKQPATQAKIVLALTAAISAACFYLAGLEADENEAKPPAPPKER